MLRKFRGMFRTILMLEDTPHSIALGTAIGLFVAWTPTVGIHMILVVAVALLMRANKVAGLIAVYISNPLTYVPMYWIEYKLGAVVVDKHVTYEYVREALRYHGLAEWLEAFLKLCVYDLAVPMWLGGIVLALAHAIPGYYVTRWAVLRYRRRTRVATSVSTAGASGTTSEHHSPLTPHSSPTE